MTHSVATFLMFDGAAEEAMNFYVSLFKDAKAGDVERWGPGEPGTEGKFKRGKFTLNGQNFFCFNSPAKHAFDFTPSISIFVDCETEVELDATFARLAEGGEALMPLNNYGFSRKFGWLNDRFGVSWQLNLP